jgi:uncharacterized metal-binding protein
VEYVWRLLFIGCAVGCAKAILANAQVPDPYSLVLTDLGIEKNKNFNLDSVDVQKIKKAVKNLFGSAT